MRRKATEDESDGRGREIEERRGMRWKMEESRERKADGGQKREAGRWRRERRERKMEERRERESHDRKARRECAQFAMRCSRFQRVLLESAHRVSEPTKQLTSHK